MERAKLIDAVMAHEGIDRRDDGGLSRQDASGIVDLVLDKLLEVVGSPYAVDELTRIRNGA